MYNIVVDKEKQIINTRKLRIITIVIAATWLLWGPRAWGALSMVLSYLTIKNRRLRLVRRTDPPVPFYY